MNQNNNEQKQLTKPRREGRREGRTKQLYKKKKKIENKEAERKVLKDGTSHSVINFKLCND